LSSLPNKAQESFKVKLLSKWQNTNLPRLNGYQIWNDITGYYDSLSNKEYVIAGTTDSIYFFDISNPYDIVLCDVEDGRSHDMVNRDYETYSHYAYCVSDNKNPGSLQVFDLQYLPDSVHKVFDSDSLSTNTHSIFISKESKRLYLCINRLKPGGVAAMDIMSLENPEHPVWIGRLNVPVTADGAPFFRNVHDVYVRNDTAYCSAEYAGIWIFDLRDLQNQKLIGNITHYPKPGYNHSSTLDKTGKYIIWTDEIPSGLDIKLYNISDLWNPRLESMFISNPGAIAHNPYWIGNFAYISSYHDGVYIYDLSDVKNPKVAGWYDTYPKNTPGEYNGFDGCWGIYPYFPSGIIAASDMSEGIFLLKPDSSITSTREITFEADKIRLYPNPASDKIQISLPFNNYKLIKLLLYSFDGKLLREKDLTITDSNYIFEESLEGLEPAIYHVVIGNEEFSRNIKLIKY